MNRCEACGEELRHEVFRETVSQLYGTARVQAVTILQDIIKDQGLNNEDIESHIRALLSEADKHKQILDRRLTKVRNRERF